MIVGIEKVRRPAVDSVDLSDLTTAQISRRGYVTAPDGTERYEVQFAVNVPAAIAEAVQLRLTTTDANEEATRARAWAAAEDLRTVRGTTGALTLAQLSNAVRLLARVVLYLLRLQLGRTEDTETEPGTTTTTTPASPASPQAASKGR